jgi:molybdopterin synthase sulfur carrier subunit
LFIILNGISMATIRIPTPLRKYTQGKEEVQVAGATVHAVIEALESSHPGIRERILDDAGKVRRFVNVFVGEEDIRFLENLQTPVAERDEISIIPAIAGGR